MVQQIEYDAFGGVAAVLSGAGQVVAQDPILRFAYTGREYDPETGDYFYNARYLDPATGRFLSEDPIGFAAGDINLYRYVGNSTPNFTDPSGLAAAGKAAGTRSRTGQAICKIWAISMPRRMREILRNPMVSPLCHQT